MCGATVSTAGIPLLGAEAATTAGSLGGVRLSLASTAVVAGEIVGLAVSTSGTVAATGITDSKDLFCEVIVNPDMIWGARANNGATSGTALTEQPTTGASAAGTVTTGVTTVDDGAVFGISGGNAGEMRRADDAAGSVSINFPKPIAIGDTFIAVHGFPGANLAGAFVSYDLTTELTEINATTAVTDMDNFATLDITTDTNDTYKTEYKLVCNSHLFGSTLAS